MAWVVVNPPTLLEWKAIRLPIPKSVVAAPATTWVLADFQHRIQVVEILTQEPISSGIQALLTLVSAWGSRD